MAGFQLPGFQGIHQFLGCGQCLLFLFMMDGDLQHPGKGRIPQFLPLGQLPFGKPFIVLPGGHLENGIFRIIGLEDHLPRLFSPSCPAGGLGQQGKAALSAAEIRQVQLGIRTQDSHQGHIGDIMALGHHLGPQEHIVIPPAEGLEDLLMGKLPAGGILVHAQGPHPRAQVPDLPFRLFRAGAEEPDPGAAAVGTFGGHRFRMAAVMAFHQLLPGVVHQGHRTVGTAEGFPAVPAQHKGGKPPAVQQYNGLLPVLHHVFQLPPQGF